MTTTTNIELAPLTTSDGRLVYRIEEEHGEEFEELQIDWTQLSDQSIANLLAATTDMLTHLRRAGRFPWKEPAATGFSTSAFSATFTQLHHEIDEHDQIHRGGVSKEEQEEEELPAWDDEEE